MVLDAKSVYESIIAKDAKVPTEQSLIAILMSIREQLRDRVVRYVWWVDTLDMVADALTKGSVPREQILALMNLGHWVFTKGFCSTHAKSD